MKLLPSTCKQRVTNFGRVCHTSSKHNAMFDDDSIPLFLPDEDMLEFETSLGADIDIPKPPSPSLPPEIMDIFNSDDEPDITLNAPLDLEQMKKSADARLSMHEALQNSSSASAAPKPKDDAENGVKGRRVIPKLDEER